MKWRRRVRDRLAHHAASAELAVFRPKRPHVFYIVSAAHHAASFVEKHLQSIAGQDYDHARIHQIVIDDASTDGTSDTVLRRIENGAGYDLGYRKNDVRRGGCANLTAGFRDAPPGSIVLQIDADDWLPDQNVLGYLDMLYHDPELWMTYNTWVFPDGRPSLNSHPIPKRVVEENAFREHAWVASHLHSFRRELFGHVADESLIDPTTGDFWTAAVDMSHYFPMLELAGRHARHVRRATYVYNLHEASIIRDKRAHQLDCEKRIRALPRYAPLESLGSGLLA